MRKWDKFLIGALAVLVFLVIWELAAPLGLARENYVSRPSLVIKAFVEMLLNGEVIHNLLVSLEAFFIGFGLAIIIGIPFGVALGRWRIMNLLFDPMLMALYTMPRLAMMPILVVWFGVGFGSTIAVVFLGVLFPVLINTAVGIREVDPVLVRAVESFGGNRWDIFVNVLLPGAVPPIMTGLRLGVGRGLLGVVVSEMYAGTKGLGHLIDLYANMFRVSELIALIGVISILGFIFVNVVRLFETRVRYWGKELEL